MHAKPTTRSCSQRAYPPRLAGVVLLASMLLSTATLRAADPTVADTSSRARRDSIASIPFKKLDADARAKVNSVVNHTTFFRRMPVEIVECDPNLFLFLIRHPDVIVEIWRYMGVTNMEVERLNAENFHAEDGAGSVGDIEFLYGDKNQHILFVKGSYDGSLLPKAISANCLLVLTCDYNKDPTGKYLVTSRLDLFVDVQNPGLDLLARTFHKVFGKTTDHNFTETASFVSQVSRTTELNGSGMLRLAGKLDDLDPAIRNKFARQIKLVHGRAKQRTAQLERQDEAKGLLSPRRAPEESSRQRSSRRSG